VSGPEPKETKLPQHFNASEVRRLLEGTNELSKSLRHLDDVAAVAGNVKKSLESSGALQRRMDEAFRFQLQFEDSTAAKMLKALSLPESTLAKQISEATQFRQQFEASPLSRMMKDLSAQSQVQAGSSAVLPKRELWESAALKGLPDWAGAAAVAKFALPDRDLARYASFMGEASKYQAKLNGMGFAESAIAAKALSATMPLGKGMFDELTKSLALAVDPFAGAMKATAQWEASLTSRLALIDAAWARPSDLGISMVGFARIARLSDAVHVARPFSRAVSELLAEELGVGADPAPDASPEERESAAIDAGLKSNLIAFPEPTYGQVVFAAGFHFRVGPTPVPVALEAADAGAVFDGNYSSVLIDVEQRLRQFVEQKLSGIEGGAWVKRRVAEPVRKRWSERQEEERDTGRPVYSLIQYADFMDIADIIGQGNNWKNVFAATFGNKEDLQVSLRRLHPVRKAIAHGRPLGRSDVLTLVSEATRILRALGVNLLQ
jgi:Swt1-like HEPN